MFAGAAGVGVSEDCSPSHVKFVLEWDAPAKSKIIKSTATTSRSTCPSNWCRRVWRRLPASAYSELFCTDLTVGCSSMLSSLTEMI